MPKVEHFYSVAVRNRGYGSFVATNKRFPGISTKPKFPMTIPFEHELLLVGKAHKI